MVRGYTTIEQSRKLAEILPVESADMKWFFWKSEIDAPKVHTFGYSKTAAESYKDTEAVYLPCWSLTSLLDVLPTLDYEFEPQLRRSSGKYRCTYEGEGEDNSSFLNIADNPVDACYEMILTLHEYKIL